MDSIYTLLEYYFKFEFKDYSGQYYGIPIIIQTVEAPDADKYAYCEALGTFAMHIKFMRTFFVPETLTIKCQKIVKEVK